MVKCAVPRCKNDSRKQNKKNNDISFHRFPKNRENANKWVTAIKRPNWEPNIRSFVCSLHFSAKSIHETKSGLRKLVEGAIPELKLEEEANEDSVEFIGERIMEPSTSRQLSNISANDVLKNHVVEQSVDCDTPRKRRLKRQIVHLQEIAKRRRLRCNALYGQRNRLKNKIVCLTEMLTQLREKLIITQEHSDILEICGASAAELFKRVCHKSRTYSPNLRSFALTLQFYSPKAYVYVRDTFNTCLPHPSTIRKWYSSVDASPGFTGEAFRVLREKTRKSESKIICSLIFDEMSIRQLEEYDGHSVHGYVDFGAGGTGNVNELASQVLVFLLVAINESWKLPIAYFFVNGVSAEQKANLVSMCLENCHDAGIEVVSITFDGCPSNFAMSKLLGCNFDSSENFNTTFLHPSTGQQVAIFLDPCHMIKLIRNTLESKSNFKNSDGGQINWQFFCDLFALQEKESFHLANKLTYRHISFTDQKMKVKLAVQLFSNSVSKALEFCDKELCLPNFKNSEATVEFTQVINNLFDIFNSHRFPNIDYKQPINEKNKDKYFAFLDSTFDYLINLVTLDEKKLIHSRNKTGFLGFCVSIISMKDLYLRLIEREKKLKFIPMYKISQDHIELLFSAIRSHGGFNNNPSALQFKAIYKKLLTHMELRKSIYGNCFPLENITLLHCSSSADHINSTTKGYRSKFKENDPTQIIADPGDVLELPETFLSEPSKQVISYIAGYVVRFLFKVIACEDCKCALVSTERAHIHKFIKLKDRGGLIYPSHDTVSICMQTEVVIKKTYQPKKNCNIIALKLVTETLKHFIGKDIFTCLHEHIFQQPPCSNHLVHLLRAVVEKYIDIRLKYLIRKTAITETKRQVYNKLTLFKGQ